MKLYYTTDGSVDENLEQVCPFGQKQEVARLNDCSYFTSKMVGSGACIKCPYCYGAGYRHPAGSPPKSWVLVPALPKSNPYNPDWNQELQIKEKLGLKQFRLISDKDYVKCSKCYTKEHQKKSKMLKFKIWFWHNVGTKLQYWRYRLEDTLLHLKCR